MKQLYVTSLLFLFGICQAGFGQKLNFEHYSVSDGLPQSQVHDVKQTQDGYIWMATYGGGLTKFDGEQFINYTTEDGLKDNAVEDIVIDSDDNIWVSTSKGGVATFKGDSLVYPIKNDSLNNYPMTEFDEFEDGSMWFGAYEKGVYRYKDDSLTLFTTEDGLASNITWDFFEEDDGKIWVATDEGLSIYDGHSFKNYTVDDGLPGPRIYDIYETESGQKWIGTNKGISIWDGEKFSNISSVRGEVLGSIFDIEQSEDGRIWIATETNGIFIYDDEQFNHYKRKNGLSSNYIYELFEDRNDHVWIATDEDGVNLFKDDAFTFYDEDSGLHNNGILNIARDHNNYLWLGTVEGLASFNGNQFEQHALPGEYENKNIWNIITLPDGDKLIGMPDYTLMRYDGETYSNFSEKYGIGELYVYDFYLDAGENLWISTDTGLFKLALDSSEVQHFTTADGLADNRVFNIYEDKSDTKWIGTFSGLNIFDGEKFDTVTVNDGLGHNKIHHITESAKGNIWLGTGGGVSQLEVTQNREISNIQNFNKKDGMRLVTTHFLWFDEEGQLWQGTNGGLQMLDVPAYRETGNMQVIHYPLSEMGIGLEFNYHALLPEGDNEVWLGSMEGLVHFDVEELNRDTSASSLPLNITGISIDGIPINWNEHSQDVQYHNGMVNFPSTILPHGNSSYEFSFKGLSYILPENVRYRYKLQGFEDEWMPVTKNNTAIYTNLEPGDYTFVVQAKKDVTGFEDSRAVYSFSIAYPFWQTYWFYALIIISTIGLIYGYIKIRLGILEKRRLKELVDEQTKDLKEALSEKEVLIKEIHHRVKNNLAVISGLLDLQMGYAENEFVNRVLSESQRRVQSISMIHEKLYQNERLAEIDFEKYARELIDIISFSFDYTDKEIEVDIAIEDFKLGVDQGIPCGLILNELVSNAFEHAFVDRNRGTIKVMAREEQDHKIILTVTDDGIGLPEDFDIEQEETLGLSLIETLCRQLEGDFVLENTDNGTKFVLQFKREEAPLKVPAKG